MSSERRLTPTDRENSNFDHSQFVAMAKSARCELRIGDVSARDVGAAFVWWENLSANGQKLYSLLMSEMGDTDLLFTFASEDGFNLNQALDELRELALLDESDPRRVRLKQNSRIR